MKSTQTRRTFLGQAAAVALGARAMAAEGAKNVEATKKKRQFDISLAAWSFHKTIGTTPGKMPMLDLPKLIRDRYNIAGLELVSTMLASDQKPYLDELAKNAASANVKILLIMIDGQGDIGSEDMTRRNLAVINHKSWIDIAAGFGCHSIRMNWKGAPDRVHKDEEALKAFIERSVPGFHELCEYGEKKNINVLIENHGGASSHIAPLVGLMKAVNHPRFGTLPDFGNFPADVDRYEAIDAFMPYAKALSAKCNDFDDQTGLETKIDFERMMQICVDKHGYNKWIGIEYEGDRLSEYDGVAACNNLLIELRG